jgi:hypothetical protein
LGLSAGRASHEAPSADPDRTPPGETAGSAAAVEWTVSPWRESPAGAALAALAALSLWLLAGWLLPGERLLSTLLGLAVMGALAPGMAPTRCRVDGVGVARRVLLAWERRPWPEIRRARLGDAGLFVSPFAQRSPLDRFRGLWLPVPRRGPAAARLVEALRQEVARHGL